MNKKAIILLGPQGSGKGTQAKKLLSHLGPDKATYLEMGQILRDKRTEDPDVDKLFKVFVDRGDRVPDHIIKEIFETRFLRLLGSYSYFILDGCVRTKEQACFVKEILENNNVGITVIVLDLPKGRCKGRIRIRISQSSKPRPDDLDTEAVENRLNGYFLSLFSIVDVIGDYEIVDARGETDSVFGSLCNILGI